MTESLYIKQKMNNVDLMIEETVNKSYNLRNNMRKCSISAHLFVSSNPKPLNCTKEPEEPTVLMKKLSSKLELEPVSDCEI